MGKDIYDGGFTEELKKLSQLEDSENLFNWLLMDTTTWKPIKWHTDTYRELGTGYQPDDPITPDAILNPEFKLLPRAARSIETNKKRTRKSAEVATPYKIVKQMLNAVDEDWFGYRNPFGSLRKPVRFPEDKTPMDYIQSKRLEITCGEAPFLVTRYDASTGKKIPLKQRTGVFDRKMRIVNEHFDADWRDGDSKLPNNSSWENKSFEALRSVYGYDLSGDNVLTARLNVLMDYEDYVSDRFNGSRITDEGYGNLLTTIRWNIWQMDGLTGMVPGTTLQARIMDWESLETIPFNSLKNDE